jgi:hypothetical protein
LERYQAFACGMVDESLYQGDTAGIDTYPGAGFRRISTMGFEGSTTLPTNTNVAKGFRRIGM